ATRTPRSCCSSRSTKRRRWTSSSRRSPSTSSIRSRFADASRDAAWRRRGRAGSPGCACTLSRDRPADSDILPRMMPVPSPSIGRRHGAIGRLVLCAVLLLSGFALSTPAQQPAAGPSAPQSPAESDRFALPSTDDGLPGVGPIRRYPWFEKLWRSRRARWAEDAAEDRGAVVLLGDSITQGWNEERLARAFPGVKIANRGISGDTTRGVLLRLDEDVLAIDPAAVVLLIGTNDLEEGATPGMIETNVRLILERLKAHDSRMPIVLNLVFPSSAKMKRPADQIREINRRYLALVRNDPQVIPLETW